MSDIVNIVFDFGAVLFTWKPGVLLRAHFPEHSTSHAHRAALVQAVFGHADWHNFDRGVLTASEVSVRTAARLGLSEPALLALINGIAEHLQPMPQTLALLAQLRALRQQPGSSLRLYFLSNMPLPYARVLQDKHEFISWFDGGIFSGDVQHIKPEPEIYDLLERRYQLDPSQTVFIDDLACNVAHAQSRGWLGIQFESAGQLKAQLQRAMNLSLEA
jgi:putative hydrolase of the HAD superfamily